MGASSPSLHGISRTVCARIPTVAGDFQLCHYENTYDHKEHLALVYGEVNGGNNVMVRVHSECFTGDVLGSLRCDCGPQLQRAMRMVAEAGSGIIVYLRQEGRGIGLEQKLRAYNLQDQGYDTVDANLLLGHQADERDYWAAAGILADLGVRSINLLTNNPTKIEHLRELGVYVEDRTPIVAGVTQDNRAYLAAKVQRMRHILDLPEAQAEPQFSSDVEQGLAALRLRLAERSPERDRPHVTVSYAQSLNGVIAGPDGQPLRLSSDGAMRLTHAIRSFHDGILVGVGTVLADNPRLTVRLVDGPQPQPIVLDATLRTPPDAAILDHPRPVWLASAQAETPRAAALRARGAEIIDTPLDAAGRVDLEVLLSRLTERGLQSVMVEGGAQVIGEFLRRRLADLLIVTIAPRYESGLPVLAPHHANATSLQDAWLPRLASPDWLIVDGDIIVWGQPIWDE